VLEKEVDLEVGLEKVVEFEGVEKVEGEELGKVVDLEEVTMKGSVEKLERVDDLDGATMEGLDMSQRRSRALHHSMGEKFLNYDTLAMEGMMGEEQEEELKEDLCVRRGRRPFYLHRGVEEHLETKHNSHLNPHKGSRSNKCLE
jgi:hypothetical protein